MGELMANTHTRVNYTLCLIASHPVWDGRSEIIRELLRARPEEMRIRGDGSAVEHYMSAQSISNLLTFMADLDLIVIRSDGSVSIAQRAERAVQDSRAFDLLVQASVRNALEKSGTQMTDVEKVIGAIRLPLVPDAKTIHAKLKVKHKSSVLINVDRFSRLLYLYACAGGIQRIVRVHYGSAEG
ncbi:hypothetical protein ACFY04_10175 [Streptomyces sp. NPDC001549]|uniref:hypothetical protein n=1 Tax=Streptomyces sp. NPDC001549 TaxID=3364586 RepID=UPI003682A5F7